MTGKGLFREKNLNESQHRRSGWQRDQSRESDPAVGQAGDALKVSRHCLGNSKSMMPFDSSISPGAAVNEP
jgi:hypothetical protein